jgi:hypothetical protein
VATGRTAVGVGVGAGTEGEAAERNKRLSQGAGFQRAAETGGAKRSREKSVTEGPSTRAHPPQAVAPISSSQVPNYQTLPCSSLLPVYSAPPTTIRDASSPPTTTSTPSIPSATAPAPSAASFAAFSNLFLAFRLLVLLSPCPGGTGSRVVAADAAPCGLVVLARGRLGLAGEFSSSDEEESSELECEEEEEEAEDLEVLARLAGRTVEDCGGGFEVRVSGALSESESEDESEESESEDESEESSSEEDELSEELEVEDGAGTGLPLECGGGLGLEVTDAGIERSEEGWRRDEVLAAEAALTLERKQSQLSSRRFPGSAPYSRISWV